MCYGKSEKGASSEIVKTVPWRMRLLHCCRECINFDQEETQQGKFSLAFLLPLLSFLFSWAIAKDGHYPDQRQLHSGFWYEVSDSN